MSYSRSKNALKRVQKLLDSLLTHLDNGDTDDVSFASTEPVKLSYQIHEGLRVADIYPEFHKYRKLTEVYRFKTKFDKVMAERRDKIVEAKTTLSKQLSKMVVNDAYDVISIIGAATKNKVNELYFPNVILENGELDKLYVWCKPAGYFIINNQDLGITLVRSNPGELAYEPTGLSSDKS